MRRRRPPTELELIREVDGKCWRLQGLRRLLVGQLALLGGLLWMAALWPARLTRVAAIVEWLWMVAAVAMLIVIAFELAARWRFHKLIDVRGPDER